jgi:hypothetical protein
MPTTDGAVSEHKIAYIVKEFDRAVLVRIDLEKICDRKKGRRAEEDYHAIMIMQ